MNKFHFSFLFFLILSFQTSAQIYVSPDGDDNNSGTFELPFKTLTKAISVSGPDSLIFMRGGVYNESLTIRLNRNGQENLYIKVWNYPGELPIFDFTNQPQGNSSRGIQISHNYWHLRGLEIRYAKDNGIHISGRYNLIENCRIHECEDTGLQISGGGSYNLVLNCDSYENYDPLTNGENADGFAPKLDVGPGNEFYGCRAWGNSDDGWDMYEADELVAIDNCWAFANGFNIWNDPNFQGDGNGFKLGGNFVFAPQLITRSVAFNNRSKGFDQNNNTAGVTVYNCTGYRNQSRNFSFPASPLSGVHVLKNNISFLGTNTIVATSEQVANSWQGFTVTNADFVSLDTALAKAPRNADSSLQQIDFLSLNSGSSLIDVGVDVGLPNAGPAPDLGAFEFGEIVPVELVSFYASVSGNSIIISWSTASELNNYGFEIQKKFRDSHFRTIGFVRGSGTTTESNEYNFACELVDQGLNIFRLKQIDFSGIFSYSDEIQINSIPENFALLQNYPNPFNPVTMINFSLKEKAPVSLWIYNIVGEQIASLINNELKEPGNYTINFNGSELSSGTYIYVLMQGENILSGKMILLK